MKFFQMCNVFINFDDAKAIHVLSLSQYYMKSNKGIQNYYFFFSIFSLPVMVEGLEPLSLGL
jgi:hypothetical protein